MKNKLEPIRWLLRVLILVAVTVLSIRKTEAAPLLAGVSKVNITKDNPTELINDPLYVKALVINDGSTQVVFVTMDIINLEPSAIAEIRSHIRKELKVDSENVIFSAAHNHWVKNQLAENYLERTIQAIKEASENMVPVRVGAGTGLEERITMNRRILLNNGKEWTIRRATPDPPEELVKGISNAYDPEIGILRVDRTDGKPLAVLYNFATHPYTGVPNRGVTASLPGFASKIIEDILGDGVVALFTNGAAGDITPVLYKDVNMPKMDEMLGTYLGVSTLKAWRKIPVGNNANIKIIRETFELPPRTASDIQKHIDTLEARQARILDYYRGKGCGSLGGGTKLNFKSFLPLYIKYKAFPDYPSDYIYRYIHEKKLGINGLEMLDQENRNDIEKYLVSIRMMEDYIVTEANLEYLRNNKPPEEIEIALTGIKIGDFVMLTFPGELFSGIGLNIKEASPHEFTFISAYTNGRIGYSPTSDVYTGDAYEVSHSILAPGWQKIFEEKAMEIIQKL